MFKHLLTWMTFCLLTKPLPIWAEGACEEATCASKASTQSVDASAPPEGESKVISKREKRMIRACLHWFQDYIPTVQRIINARPIRQQQLSKHLKGISQMREVDCQVKDKRRQILRQLQHHLKLSAESKVLILAPFSGAMMDMGKSLKQGFQDYYKTNGMSATDLIFLDTGGDAEKMFEVMREAFLENKVRLMVGGITVAESKLLQKWSKRLRIPTVLVNGSASLDFKSSYTFRIFPTQRAMAHSLAKTARSEGFERVGILRPNRPGANSFSQIFTKALADQNIHVVKDVSYVENDFSSLEAASNELFQLRPEQRKDEYDALIAKEMKQAKSKGIRFDPKSVRLSPNISFDALFFPDDFRMVKHALKLFQYLGIERMRFMGNQEWRSKSLVTPFDEHLLGSVFIDYMGLYLDLPKSLRSGIVDSKFLEPMTARSIDYRMIGYLSAITSSQSKPNQPLRRSQLANAIRQMKFPKELTSFQRGSMFSSNQELQWPNFIFRVQNGDISLLTRY